MTSARSRRSGWPMGRRTARGGVALALWLGAAGAAAAQGIATPPPSPPPALPAPQATILWYPAPSRCTFFTPDDWARYEPGDPETWRFRFLVMSDTKPSESAGRTERGYVMTDGLLRELEKVRSGADADGATVTVWRSVGEPRLNITTTLRPDGESEARHAGRSRLAGTLATIRGEGRDLVDIVGSCAE